MTCERAAVLALLAAVAFAGAGPAAAEVSVDGDAESLVVVAEGDDLASILAGIGEHLAIPLAAPEELADTPASGRFEGPLREVLRALMPSESFMVAYDGAGTITGVRFLTQGDVHHAPVAKAAARPAGGGNRDAEGEPPGGAQAGGQGMRPSFNDPQAAAGGLWQRMTPARKAELERQIRATGNRPSGALVPPEQGIPPPQRVPGQPPPRKVY